MPSITSFETMAMLELPQDEREMLGKCIEALADSFTKLEHIEAEGVEPLVTVLDIHNILREDRSEKLLTRAEILSNAPEQCDGYFQVPGTLE